MLAIFTIVRYPKFLSIAGLFSMAIFRIPFAINNKISFYKLLGCGRGSTFSLFPDLSRWAIFVQPKNISSEMMMEKNQQKIQTFLFGKFVASWFSLFHCTATTFILQPISGHGSWDGYKVYNDNSNEEIHTGKLAVLTRATIRLQKLSRFWQHVKPVSKEMLDAQGYIFSIGVGEVPWIKQATFSIWENTESMKAFAFNSPRHKEVINKTRVEHWYSEEMFVRFSILAIYGKLENQ